MGEESPQEQTGNDCQNALTAHTPPLPLHTHVPTSTPPTMFFVSNFFFFPFLFSDIFCTY